eukprot:SAG31_NODE_1948_length_6834_cov_16.124276_2_plen_169_part_00
MTSRPEHPQEPSVQRAIHWFFDTVLPSVPGRVDSDATASMGPATRARRSPLRNANIIFLAKDPTSDTTYVSHVRNAGRGIDHSTATHTAIPFSILRDVVPMIPQTCNFGDTVFSSQMLPQGSGIGSPSSILQAAYQRSTKFTDARIPPLVRELISGPYVLQYVDDCLA